ncbi:MAG TPA: fumarylacetoacetate hydrolase family protein [Candidatus Binatia bacterium]|nr:fumarylacetoacetate hydrolase family protein [Candidatus Binatia bacterium]
MRASRSSFLAGAVGTAALAQTPLAVMATPADVAKATQGLTFTMLRTGSGDHLAVRTSRGLVDVVVAASMMGIASPPRTTDDVIAGRGNVAALPQIVAHAPAGAIRRAGSVGFAPVVTAPQKIVCVGLNYRAHIVETNAKQPIAPELFNKYNTALNRHNGTIPVSHMDATQFDYESELVIVMGKTASNVSEANALNYVFGYAAGNDFTARDLQTRITQWMTGKTPDHFAPIGPWLVTADQIPDPQTLQVQTYVNDETTPRQDQNTGEMIFSCAQIISYTSKYITLQPGDVIFSGTPSGVILGYPKDKQVWLKAGDRVRTSITKLGDLRFTLT